jgi:hypothetical protein
LAHTVEEIVCPACTAVLDVKDQFCRHCGMPTSLREARGALLGVGGPVRANPIDSPWVVLALLLCALGPFALPLLYKSRAFSLPVKILLTVVVLAIAVLAVWITLHLLGQIVAPIKEVWAEMEAMR